MKYLCLEKVEGDKQENMKQQERLTTERIIRRDKNESRNSINKKEGKSRTICFVFNLMDTLMDRNGQKEASRF